MDDSSDDSDICESSRNVQSILVKSRISQEELDDYAYKRRLGDLIFDANFEAGNLGYVENIDRYEYDLMVRPDVSDARHRIWFNFRVSNQRYDQCVILTFVNISENLSLFHEGYSPVIRSRKKPNWVNLDEEQVFYYRSKSHGNRYVLSLAIRFSTQDDEHQLALFYPYSYSTLCDFLARWLVELKRFEVRRALENQQKQHRATSKGKRTIIPSKSPEPPRKSNNQKRLINVDLDEQLRTRSSLETRHNNELAAIDPPASYDLGLTVDIVAESALLKSIYCVSINEIGISECRSCRSVVVIMCRIGGGNLDSVASSVCQGLMDYLLSDSLIARAARECIDFSIFPMLDPDSIYCGNSCTNLLGRQPHESVALTQTKSVDQGFFEKIERKLRGILVDGGERRRTILLELSVDLELMGSRILGSHFNDALRMERHLSVPKTMSKFIEGFYLEACRFTNRISKGACNSSWLGNLISDSNNVDHYRFELSPFGSFRRSLDTRDYLRYDRIAYLKMGKAIVYSLVDLLGPKHVDYVASLLDKFQHQPNNVDELTLRMANLHCN